MPRLTPASLLASALLAAGLGPAQATEVLLPRNDKVEAPHAGKGFGKESSTALPVVAMAVRPVPEPAPEPTPPAPTFTGGGELGFAAASGNSNTESFNGRLDLTYTDAGAWRHSASLFGLHSRSEYLRTHEDGSQVRDTRTTANRYTVTANSAYLMDDRGTLNTSVRHEEDDFGTYSRQQSVSLSYGNRVIENERAHLDLQVGPGFRRAFDFYTDLFAQGYAPPMSDTQISNVWDEFAAGFYTFYITGPWNIGEFRRRLPPELKDKWTTAPLPGPHGPGAGLAGGTSLVIFASSPHADAAWQFIEYLSEPAQQLRFLELTGDLPARRSAWEAPQLTQDAQMHAFRDQLERVRPVPPLPEWEHIAIAVRLAVERVVRGHRPVDATLKTLDAETDKILEKRRELMHGAP